MAKPGPKPTPRAILEARGSRDLTDTRRNRHGEVDPPHCRPQIPNAFKNAEWAPYWDDIADALDGLKILSHSDGMSLAVLCDALHDFITASEKVEIHGAVQTSETGLESLSGWYRVKTDAAKRLDKALSQFGMSPSSRAGIKQIQQPSPESAIDAIRQLMSGEVD